MFHCNGWGGVYALTGMGGTHVVLRAVDGERDLRPDRAREASPSPAWRRRCCARSSTTRTRRSTAITHAAALHRRRRAAAGRLHRAAREASSAGSSSRSTASPRPRRCSPCRGPDHATARRRLGAPRARRRRRASASRSRVARRRRQRRCPRTASSVGEVCARSNVVFEGYWEQPEETAKAIRDGWFHTGDLARLGRERQHPHRRPQEGRDHLGRREHQLAGDRGRALPAPGGARVRGDRRAAREVGRDAEGARRAARRARRRRGASCSRSAASASPTSSARRRSSSWPRCRARPPASSRSSCCASATGRAASGA